MAQFRRFTTGILPVFAIAACSQIIGLSDYEKGEEEPDNNGGESPGGDGGKGGSSGTSTGGRAGKGGTGGRGGTGGTGAVQGGEGGEGAVGGEGGQDEGGASGSSTGGSRGGTAGRGGSGGTKSTTGGTAGAGIAGGGAGGVAGGGMGGSAGGSTCMTVPIALRGASFDSETSAWASYGEPSARTIIVTAASQSLTANTEPNIAWFAQVVDWYAGHFQRITIPAGAVTMTLTGYRYVTTTETTTSEAYDDMQIQMWDDAVNPTEAGRVGTFVELSNLDATGTWVSFSGSVAVSSRAGRTVDFDMWGSNDDSNDSQFYVDSLVLTAFVCL